MGLRSEHACTRIVQPSSSAAERVFSLLQNSFSHQQRSSLEDYISVSVVLQLNILYCVNIYTYVCTQYIYIHVCMLNIYIYIRMYVEYIYIRMYVEYIYVCMYSVMHTENVAGGANWEFPKCQGG